MTPSAKATRPRSIALVVAALSSLCTGITLVGMAPNDVAITDRPYIRHDAGLDLATAVCGSDATTPGPGGDFGGNRQQNEPAVAINPRNPQFMVASSNDGCTSPVFADGWLGFYVSRDGGTSWVNSLLPGYPTDTSVEGTRSPIFNRAWNTGDPIMDWDNDNRLFLGGVAFNRIDTNGNSQVSTNTNADIIVSTWVTHDSPSSPLGMDYLRTVIVGEGTPSQFFRGRFNDKPSLRVDDWPQSPRQGNVYVAWTIYSGILGRPQIRFARSTDHGVTFSRPIKITPHAYSAQGTDIAVAPDGTVYVAWRQYETEAGRAGDAIVIARSSDGGDTFSEPQIVRSILPYDRSDQNLFGDTADCGDGFFECVSQFVFYRTSTLPQIVADGQGHVYATWEELISKNDDGNTYRPDGQAAAVVSKSTDGGRAWSAPVRIDPAGAGHQSWPNIEFDRTRSTLVAIYYDTREDPSYAANRPPGNTAAATSPCDGTPECNVMHTYMATSTDGMSWIRTRVTSVGHQPEYEMYDGLDGTFHGDYLGVDAIDGVVFGVWTDNRDVVPGLDIRESTVDGFDVLQCRADPAAPNTCPNAGGLNQNIYGARVIVP